ncbi:MAG: cell division protein FtsL [Polyangiaceae bacterium]|nr:cell division protein FtsL [Polyangiaceae bacterium]
MKGRGFLALWVLAVLATVAAFVVHLGLRGRIVDLGYKLGRVRAEQARLREVTRVLELEAASHRAPQRVEMVARTLLGMTPPAPERILPVRHFFPRGEEDPDPQAGSESASSAAPSTTKPAPSAAPRLPATAAPGSLPAGLAPYPAAPGTAPLAAPAGSTGVALPPSLPPSPVVLPPADPLGDAAVPAAALRRDDPAPPPAAPAGEAP